MGDSFVPIPSSPNGIHLLSRNLDDAKHFTYVAELLHALIYEYRMYYTYLYPIYCIML